jgi:hypothetical protein
VEGQGFDVNGMVAHRKLKGLMRQARSTTGEQLTGADPGSETQASPASIYGVPINYPLRGLWPSGAGAAEGIVGDFSQGIIAIRQDLTWKILDQAVLNDNAGAVVYNLAQQDMVALRVVARFAWQVAQTPEPENIAGAYPFGVLLGA